MMISLQFSSFCPVMSWHFRNVMHVCLMSLPHFCNIYCLRLVSFFSVSCHVCTLWLPISSNPLISSLYRKYQDIIFSFMPVSFHSGRSGGEGMWRNSSLCPDRFFSLSQIRTHIAIQGNERGREGLKMVERERDSEKSHDLLWMWLPPLLPF